MFKYLFLFLTIAVAQNCYGGMFHLEKGDAIPDPRTKKLLYYTAVLDVRYAPKKGTSEKKAARMMQDTLSGEFFSRLEDSICITGREEAKKQRAWVHRLLKERHVPVRVTSVRYTCKR